MRILADEQRVGELITCLAEAIRRDVTGDAKKPWALVGIRSRGDDLARRLAAILHPDHLGCLDITLYRDDLSEISAQPVVRATEMPFALDGLNVVLVDDVIMTGRSIRAALQSLIDFGRPARVWLSVLVDRGGRELPIHPDHKALDLTPQLAADASVQINVRLRPTDECDQVVLVSAPSTREAGR